MIAPPLRRLELLVLDDHPVVRQGVTMLVQDMPEVGRCRGAASTAEAVRQMEEAPADVAVVDMSLKGESGLDAIAELLGRWPQLRIVVLTMHADPVHCQRALNRGAKAFVTKEDADDELCRAILAVAEGETFLSSVIRPLRLGNTSAAGGAGIDSVAAGTAELTQRERQILELIGVGRSMAEIATQLGRSAKTIDAHRNNLRVKLGLRNNQLLLQFSAKWMQFDRTGLKPAPPARLHKPGQDKH